MSIINDLISNPKLANEIGTMHYTYKEKEKFPFYRCFLHSSFYYCGAAFQILNGPILDVVRWKPYIVTIYETYGRDIISFDFSGCVMAKFMLYNNIYVAHIHCDTDPVKDQKSNWINFVIAHKKDIKILMMFQPGQGAFNVNNDDEIWGVIANNKCYSVYVGWQDERYKLLSIKEHKTQGILPEDYAPILYSKNLYQRLSKINPLDHTKINNEWDKFWHLQESKFICR